MKQLLKRILNRLAPPKSRPLVERRRTPMIVSFDGRVVRLKSLD